MEVYLTPEEFAHRICKEIQNNKNHAKPTIPWLLSVAAEMKESLGETLLLVHGQIWVGLNLLGHQPQSHPVLHTQGQQKVLPRPLVTK